MGKLLAWNNTLLTYNHKLLVYEPPIPSILGFLNFYTDAYGPSQPFGFPPPNDVSVSVNAGILNWNLGDSSSSIDSNSISHEYSIIGTKTVNIFNGTTSGASSIQSLAMNSVDLVGTADISSLSNLTWLDLAGNTNLTKIIAPVSSAVYTRFTAHYCDLTGTLDVSGLTGLGGIFFVYNNGNLTKILNPVSSNTFVYYYAQGCNLTGTLDLSGLTGLGGDFEVNGNPNLKHILNPVSSTYFNTYYVYDCSLAGTLDVSGLSGLANNFSVYNNKELTHISLPANSYTFQYFNVFNNDLQTLDISGLTGLGGQITMQNNPNLTHIENPVSGQPVNFYWAYNCNLTGTLDVSGFSNLGGSFDVMNNINLTKLVIPASSNPFTEFNANSCNLLGTLDVSGLSRLGGNFFMQYNYNLAKIIFPTTDDVFTGLYIYDCKLTGKLDVSCLHNLGGTVVTNDNAITELIVPDSSQIFNQFSVANCSLGYLDISSLINIGGYLQFASNINLQTVVLPTSFNQPITHLEGYDCSLKMATVDTIFSKLNTFYTTNAPTQDVYIDLHLGKNSWPLNGRANSDIQNLYSVFALAGHDVSIIINLQPVKFNVIIDTSMWVNLGDTSIAYTGALTPADLTWGFWPGTPQSSNTYDGKSYWSWTGGIYASPAGTMIIDLSTHNTEFLASGYKTINGDYYNANINCQGMNISEHGFFTSICSIGSLRSFWKYDISTNTGQNFNHVDAYTGYPVGDDYVPYPDGTQLQQAWYHEGGNTMYILTLFDGYPAEMAFLQYHYDTSTMYRFDELGFRDSSVLTPVTQINGIPFPGGTALTDINEIHGGRIFLCHDSSIYMYNISTSTGYYMSETGLFDGTTTTNYDTSSLVPNFNYPTFVKSYGQYLVYGSGAGNEVWKYDVSNNKFVEKITNFEIVNEASISHSISGDSPIGTIRDIAYDIPNHRLWITTDASWRNFYFFNLDEWTLTQVDSSTIVNNNNVDFIANTDILSIDTINKKLVFGGGGNANLSDKSLYEIAY